MVKLNRIYTRTGDDGSTGLVDGTRVSKADARVAAYGSVDELNAVLGLVRLHAVGDPELAAMLGRIQNELFDLGADLATPLEPAPDWEPLRITPGQIERLEAEIDAMNERLQPLDSFILPGGSALAAHLHLARTVARRAERDCVRAANTGVDLSADAIRYLNRLSDHLFCAGRRANADGADDVKWVPGATR
ncbi:MAG: cob(I)yrinic acid a,c-diamide adenosyltransferase [Brevundimonas sp.]